MIKQNRTIGHLKLRSEFSKQIHCKTLRAEKRKALLDMTFLNAKRVASCKYVSLIECNEKTKSFNLKIPQPDSEQRHNPDFRTVFKIMIGPFSSCKIGKT